MAFTDEQRKKAAATRARNLEEKRRRQELAGIPDSKPPAAPAGTYPEPAILDCHVGGVLIRDLPVEVQGRILYQQTDEGIEEFNRGKVEGAARVTRDEYTGACLERRDAIREQGMEPWEAPNPLKEVADAHVEPGMKAKFLSPKRIDEAGTRGFEIVRHENGEPVKVRNMVLGQMPASKAEQRNKHYRDQANAAIAEIKRQYAEEGGATAVGDISTR